MISLALKSKYNSFKINALNGAVMKNRIVSIRSLAIASISIPLASAAHAQSTPEPLPANAQVDANGVDLASGQLTLSATDVTIGGVNGLSFARVYSGTGWRASTLGTICTDPGDPSKYIISMGSSSETFTLTGSLGSGTFTSDVGSGATLTYDSVAQEFTYTSTDGTQAIFDADLASKVDPTNANEGVLVKTIAPNGAVTDYHYKEATVSSTTRARLQSVTNAFGYQLHMNYADDSPANTTELNGAWLRITKVTGFNRTVDYCSSSANTCSFSKTWPHATYTGSSNSQVATVTDTIGRVLQYTYTSNNLTGARWPGSSSDNVTIGYDGSDRVSSVNRGFGTWSYVYSDTATERTTTVTLPGGGARTVVSTLATGLIKSDKDPLNRTTSYLYDSSNRLTRVTSPHGNYVSYTYNARGGITEVRSVAASGSGLSDIVTSATYPATCSNQKTCNKPTTTTDALGGVTNYTYDSAHGSLLTVTAPAPSGGAARPQTRFTYSQKQARYKSSSSGFVNGPSIWVSMTTSACASGSSCSAGANETLTTIAWPTTASANNLLPTSVTVGAGDNSVTSTRTTTYNDVGDVVTVDGPLPGAADTTKYYYDALRRVVGVVGPDPDGGGVLKYRAAKTTYNTLGLPTTSEIGTATGQGGTALPGFVRLQRTETAYDAYARPVKGVVYDGAGSTILSVSQTSYTSRGQVECVAQRMNPASFSSPPSACSLGTPGAYGADRISKTTYDLAGQVLKTTSAFGTAIAQDSTTATYNSGGRLSTLTDANGNRTTYEYDGFNRPLKVRFPSKTTTGVSSTTDYVQNTYDAYGRRTSLRQRDGSSFSYTYDSLGRVTFENAPGSDKDYTYTYDNFGRRLTTSDGSITLTYAYDALGRTISENHSVLGAVGYTYDAASRMTRLSYPGSFFVDYDYDNTGAMTSVEENGTTSLATYAYDDLGRRASLTMGNGAVTTYGYDGGSRLTSLAHDLSGTVHDQTWIFAYNPAGQITSQSSYNALYDWPVPGADYTDTYVANGLNQYTSAGGTSVSHDSLGNTTAADGSTFGFDKRNRLISATPGGSLSYDSRGRLYEESASGSTTRFNYAHSVAIEEKNTSGTVLRRYVPGAGNDETLVWYEGSGTTDKRYLLSDVRGSIAAVANASGVATAVNRYNEYGVPHASNSGRFGFTGQMRIFASTSSSLHHFKARAYHPSMGRFLSPDPIGYGDGMNMYRYVLNDPINFRDPTGKKCTGTATISDGPIDARGDDDDPDEELDCGPDNDWGDDFDWEPDNDIDFDDDEKESDRFGREDTCAQQRVYADPSQYVPEAQLENVLQEALTNTSFTEFFSQNVGMGSSALALDTQLHRKDG